MWLVILAFMNKVKLTAPAAYSETKQNVSGVIKAPQKVQDLKVVEMRVMDYFEVRGMQAVIWLMYSQ